MMTASTIESLTLNVAQEIHVRATLSATFDAILHEMGPANQTPDGEPMPMKIEPHPGGRWFRDLGNDNGHLWGQVQAIKRPTLLEITGPLFISTAAVSNVQYRLKEVDGGTLITFRHIAFGFVPEDYRERIGPGWNVLLRRVCQTAESIRNTR
jgi:Activator of Hsp90 ATPase homolog 1-like protein